MKQSSPVTRHSLILRLPTMSDAAAWEEFVSIYEPMVYRFAVRNGLQEADARELVQNVLIAVAQSVSRWQPGADRGRFRTWLFRIARNQLLKLMTRVRRGMGIGQADASRDPLLDVPERTAEWHVLRADLERELFRTAAAEIRSEFLPKTWEAFWQSCVENRPIEEVAQALQMSTSSVYVSRCRVIQRLKVVVRQWEADND